MKQKSRKSTRSAVKTWTIWTSCVMAFLLILNVVSLVFIPKVFDNLFGGDVSSGRGEGGRYVADEGITDKATAKANGEAVTKEICSEGFVLLKNEKVEGKPVLPLKTDASNKKKISVFGKNSVNLAYGGSGSGGSDSSNFKTIYESLSAANYEYNPTLKSFYESEASGSGRPGDMSTNAGTVVGFATGETPVASYTGSVQSSFVEYSDMALVVITRTVGESYDAPITMKEKDGSKLSGAASVNDHYLELDQNEQDMLQMVCENFSRVVLIVNSSQTFELGFLDDIADGDATMNAYDYASKIQGAVWIGGPGSAGIMALGEILNGTVNPSGRTVDTYARDFTKSPAYQNFGAVAEGNSTSDTYYVGSSQKDGYYFSDYEEGIYVGYRYYETRSYTDGEEWYKNNVIYPFGYGLSYTQFDWELMNKAALNGKSLTKDGKVEVVVHVDNLTEIAGKDVVQLYVRAPYTAGGIEKADKVLCAFGKTESIVKGDGGYDVKLYFDAYDFASYDYNDANGNGHKGYELDAGEYTFMVSKNAHEVVDSFTMTVESGIFFDEGAKTTVENRYEDADDQLVTLLSRSDWEGTWPQARTKDEKTVNNSFISEVDSKETNNPLTKDSEEVKNADLSYATKKDKEATVKVFEMEGEKYDSKKWDAFLSEITLNTMQDILKMAAFGTDAEDYIGKPKTIEPDGPVGFTQFMGGDEVQETCAYASECVLGSTWSVALAEKMGKAVGNEGIIGNYKNGQTLDPYSGWYAPGINLHRTPFGGRNYEYYSEDSTLSGLMAANTIKGAWSKGVYTYMKHFAVNEQETHRNGVCTWLTEQTLRELYLKPFELAITESEGSAHGLMSSFNRIGAKWTGGDYRLITEILRNEWGFEGAVICDFKTGSYMNLKQMQYAGGDIYLNNVNDLDASRWVDKNNPVDIYVIKNCFKNYMYLIANSNAMMGLDGGYSTRPANWKLVLFAVDAIAVVSFAVWGVCAFKKKETTNAKNGSRTK